jgi:hypothetical protein
VQVVDIQISSFSSKDEESFTINLGVFDPGVWEKCWIKEPPRFINEEDCFPRIRIGQLLNEGSIDHWWVCSAKINEGELGEEIESLLEKKCLPFLDDMLDRNEIVNFYTADSCQMMPIEKVYLAIIKNSIGDTDCADALLSEVANLSKAWANRVDQVRSQLD